MVLGGSVNVLVNLESTVYVLSLVNFNPYQEEEGDLASIVLFCESYMEVLLKAAPCL